MAKLKYKVKTLDDVPEAMRELYVGTDDGEYRLDAEGAVGSEFRENNRNLFAENEELKRKLADASKAAEEKGGEAGAATKKATDLAARIEALETAKQASDAALAKATAAAAAEKVKSAVTNFALARGGLKEAADDIGSTALADGWAPGEGGVPVRKKGDTVVLSTERPGQPQSFDEYLPELVERKPYLFASSSGDGAEGSVIPAGAKLVPFSAENMAKYAEQIDKGEVHIDPNTMPF